MLIKLNEWLKRTDNLSIPHRGIVKDNIDPKKLGRLKVEILNLLVGETVDLPWCYPNNPYGLGGKTDSSGFSVPEIDSELVITFPFKNIYMPVYIGYWQNELIHQTDFDTNYPESYGFRDSTGNIFHVNKSLNTAKFTHKTGSSIEFLANGSINIISPNDFNVLARTITLTENP